MQAPIIIPARLVKMEPMEAQPIKGFEFPANYPNCCARHKEIKDSAIRWFEKFPNCCEEHRKLISEDRDFKKAEHEPVIEKVLNQVAYTEHFISQRINNEDAISDIGDYLEYNLMCFGHPSYGEHVYTNAIKHFMETSEAIPTERRLAISHFFAVDEGHKKPKNIDVQALFDIYAKWLKIFPFELSHLNISKHAFERTLPLLSTTPVVNKYTGMAKAMLTTQDELFAFLIGLTKELLARVDTVKQMQDGIITEPKKLRIEIINSNHRISTDAILNEYAKGERKYINTIKLWLAQQKQYFKEISEVITQPIVPEPKLVDTIVVGLIKYGFNELPKIRNLAAEQKEQLFALLKEKSTPYAIAMLNFLGFPEHATEKHFKTKFKLHKFLADVFETNERDVKGNLSVLNPYSSENRKRFTAHLHQDSVIKDYQNIK